MKISAKERAQLESVLEALGMASAYFDSLAVTEMTKKMAAQPYLSPLGVRLDAEVEALAELLGVAY